MRSRPSDMARYRFWLSKMSLWIASRTGFGGLILQCEKGAPFVANLRLQWLDIMRQLSADRRPDIIQLVGDRDDLVSTQDQRDVAVAKDFLWVRVHNSNHTNILNVSDKVVGHERQDKIGKSFGDDTDLTSLRQLAMQVPQNEDMGVEEAVIILHGIRDMASWAAQFEMPLQKAFREKNISASSKLHITRPSYGYFGMGPFLLWADRQQNVRWFMDEFTDLKARFPNLKKVHFIGHSNGSYVLASALVRYKSLKVDNIVFGGCVLPRDFDWDSIRHQFSSIRNYVGASDWVVAIFPSLFEYRFLKFMNKDLGSAGFNGFTQAIANDLETRYLKGEHGAALVSENVQSIVDFIIKDKKSDNTEIVVSKQSWVMEFSSKLCVVYWGALVTIVVMMGWLFVHLFSNQLPGGLVGAMCLYMAMVIFLLYKI